MDVSFQQNNLSIGDFHSHLLDLVVIKVKEHCFMSGMMFELKF